MQQNSMNPAPSPVVQQKLTSWKGEPSIAALKGDLEMAKPWHDTQMTKIQRWNDLMTTRGSAAQKKVKGRSSVQPKLIRRQAEWRYSALTEPFLGSNKLYKISPVTFEDTHAARQNELVLNWQWRTKMNRVKFIDDFVRSNVDEGTCIVRLGWKRATVQVKQMAPEWTHYEIADPADADTLQKCLAMQQENPRQYDEETPPELKAAVDYYQESGTATTAVQTGQREVMVEKVLENFPTAEVLNPQNFYLDPSCNGDPSKALFAVVSFETNKAELQKEPKRYKNLDAVNWEANTPLTNPDHETKSDTTIGFKDQLRKKVVAYEYWGFCDIKGDGVLMPIVCTWIGDTLIRMEENPFPDQKLPFVITNYLPVKRDVYGEPDAELLEDNQAILGAVSRGMIDLLGRSANGQQGFAKGMLDALNRRRFENGQDYEFNPNVTPAQGLIEHKYPELPQSALLMLNLQNQEAEALTGVKSFGGGISGEAYGDVAAGIRGVLDAASKREMAILRRLAKGITEIGNKIIAMNGEFMSEKEIVRVTNTQFVEVSREDLAGNFDLETDISTAEVDNQKAQDLAFMLQTLGPKGDPGMVMMILADIARLKRMPELAHKLENYQPTPSPEQQEMTRLAIEKAKKENEKLDSEIRLNDAKAQQALAQKDQADLDFVEQETGTKHARDMDKQRAQSQGNQNLAVTKALATPLKPDQKKPDIEAAVGFNQLSDKMSEAGTGAAESTVQRDQLASTDPRFNLGSMHYDPSLDPSQNPALSV